MNNADLLSLIRQKATAAGVDPDAAIAIAQIESGGDPLANKNSNSQYKGLYQLGSKEWNQYGNGNIYDPAANTDAFLSLYKNNSDALTQKLSRAPTPGEAYLAHQQGASGAAALLQNPNMNAVDALLPFYGSRTAAASAIRNNGGDVNGTAGDFAGMWTSKVNNAAGVMPQTSPPQQTQITDTTPSDSTQQQGLLSPKAKSDFQLAMGLLAAAQPQMNASAPQAMVHRPQSFNGLLG